MANPTKKDRDEITVAKSIFDEIVEFTEHEETLKEKRARSGGKARAAKLTDAERSAIAKKAAAKSGTDTGDTNGAESEDSETKSEGSANAFIPSISPDEIDELLADARPEIEQ